MMRIEEVFVLICVISLQLLAILFPCMATFTVKHTYLLGPSLAENQN